ncbi:MAG: hypothetical protein OXC81_02615, partial [Betaproteobacteria bacterium]|nr:hypothetical protein [Betaproteobacteria bacterium]
WQQIKSAASPFPVANPPYLTSAETAAALANGSLRDPIAALDGGSDGLDSLRSAIDAAGRGLRQGGWLIIEHGYRQQDAVGSLLVDAGFGQIGSHCDLAGWPRVAVAQRNRI